MLYGRADHARTAGPSTAPGRRAAEHNQGVENHGGRSAELDRCHLAEGDHPGHPRVAGVVAIATDRTENIYEGAAGKRMQGGDADMTTDTVFAIFSTTKAITGTAALQLVEDGRLELDAPAKIYAPDIGKCQVLEGFDAGDSRGCARPGATSPPGCCCCTPPASATTSSTRTTTASPRSAGSRACSRRRRRRSTRPFCSIPATSGNTAPTSTGSAR